MRALAFVVLFAAGGFVPNAAAWPVVQATAVEPAGANFRTTFTVNFVGTGPVAESFVISAAPMFACTAPAGWDCGASSKNPSTTTYFRVDGALPPPALTFSVVCEVAEPCVGIQFFDAASTLLYEVSGCLDIDGPVAVCRSSWGAIKSTYR